MKRLNRKLSSGELAVMAVLLLCMILAVTIAAIRVASGSREEKENQFVELEQPEEISEIAAAEEEPDSRPAAGETVRNEGTPDKFIENGPEEAMDMVAAEDQEEDTQEEETEAVSGTVSETAHIPDYEAEDRLSWPVSGNVVLDFSMDRTIYFPTLKQYKYNPAIVISNEAGTAVEAAADGKVMSVEVNEETGTTVTMDMGNGYTAVYGQLKEVPVKEGNVVYRHELIGYISEPTKYYSIEGSNLYFEVQKDGVPVDPLDYLE